MNGTNALSITRPLITASLALIATLTPNLAADWPTDPGSPLIIGQAEGFFGPRISITSTDDNATWVAWQDSFCVGTVRLQRISLDGQLMSPIGISIQEDPTCGNTTPPVLLGSNNSAIATRSGSSLVEYPLQRLESDGSLLWPEGFSAPSPQGLRISGITELSNGDTLIVSAISTTIRFDRVDESGNNVWKNQSIIGTGNGSNFRVFSVVPDPAGGAYIFWDSFLTYTKLIKCMRIDDQGNQAWDAPVQLIDPLGITSSRHSDPVAVSDGDEGAMIVWTQGFESGHTAAPQRVQHILPDGSLTFPIDGLRVSLETDRQFNANVQTDPATGDLFIVWRDGFGLTMTLNAQRYSISGERLWGDTGVEVAPINPTNDSFDILWHNNQLSIAIADPSGVMIHNIDGDGLSTSQPWTLSTAGPAEDIQIEMSANGIVAVWQADGPINDDLIVAQRINPDGSLGNPTCQADLNADDDLNFFDISAFLAAFNNRAPAADFNNDGLFNFFDISAFLNAFAAGCP